MPKGKAKEKASLVDRKVFTKWRLLEQRLAREKRSTVFGSCLSGLWAGRNSLRQLALWKV
jgi:hypothetical protein